METLGEKIRNLREAANLSQEELGYRLGVTRQAVSLWETDSLTPKLSNIIALCEIFNVSADYLLLGGSLPAPVATPKPTQERVTQTTVECEPIVLPKTKKTPNEFLKAMIWVTSIFIMMFIVWVFVIDNFNDQARYKNYVPVHYSASYGGTVDGDSWQKVIKGEDSTPVTAIPYDGYYFVGWSDGLTEPTRHETNVRGNQEIQIRALFSEITDEVKVMYDVKGGGRIEGREYQRVQNGYDAISVTAEATYYSAIFVSWSDGLVTPTRQDKCVTEDMTVTAQFGFSVEYLVEGKGLIKGTTSQKVVYKEDATPVTAVPYVGYTFVGWSDGVTTATRHDIDVTHELSVTAIFVWRESDDFIYHYGYATGNNDIKSINLSRGSAGNVKFIVPTREHFTFLGWYLDEDFTNLAANANGESVLGEAIFKSPSRDLYARWQADDVVTYKILMVYVTQIDAALIDNDGRLVHLQYSMSDIEREMCKEISCRFADELNYKLDGLVNFEVDTYFTSRTIGHESINFEQTRDRSYYISPEDIPELSDSVLNNYRKVFVTCSFGETLNNPLSKSIGQKYVNIYFDSLFESGEFDTIFENEYEWQYLMDRYMQFFIESVATEIDVYGHYSARSGNRNKLMTKLGHYTGYREIDKMYLLGCCPVDLDYVGTDLFEAMLRSQKVGIPYSYWVNE
ncbi:MAG: InlB B-repeat-containing protein [Clostridiales bacterium]|nr:InlB B-repeat-containing protein [Clostridiales bacterium]